MMIYNVDREMVVEKNSFVTMITRKELGFKTIEINKIADRFCAVRRKECYDMINGLNWQDNIVMGEIGRYLVFQKHFIVRNVKVGAKTDYKYKRESGIMCYLDCGKTDLALWLCGWLNTEIGHKELYETCTAVGGGAAMTNWNSFSHTRLPDYHYYLSDRPNRVNIYLDWIRHNIHDKATFLAGIDQAFKEMIDDI